jgi:predicted DNA-binding transcriptional regulator AlpA
MGFKRLAIQIDPRVREQAGDWLMDVDEVCQVLRVSRAHWWAGIKSGRYPQGVSMGRSRRWSHSTIMKLMGGEG